MEIIRVGVDLAKNVYQVHGVDRKDEPVWRRQLSRQNWLAAIVKKIEPGSEIGIEACAGAHHWARELQARGYVVKMVAPQFVKPYVKSNKSDCNDAEAICEAMSRPTMRFVSIKSVEQQDDSNEPRRIIAVRTECRSSNQQSASEPSTPDQPKGDRWCCRKQLDAGEDCSDPERYQSGVEDGQEGHVFRGRIRRTVHSVRQVTDPSLATALNHNRLLNYRLNAEEIGSFSTESLRNGHSLGVIRPAEMVDRTFQFRGADGPLTGNGGV